MVPREVHVLTSGPCEYVTLHLTRDSADVSELRILRWDDPTSLTAQRWCFLHTHTHTHTHTCTHTSLSLTPLTLTHTPHSHTSQTHTPHTHTHTHTSVTHTHPSHTHPSHSLTHTNTHLSHTPSPHTHFHTPTHTYTNTRSHTSHLHIYSLAHTSHTHTYTHTLSCRGCSGGTRHPGEPALGPSVASHDDLRSTNLPGDPWWQAGCHSPGPHGGPGWWALLDPPSMGGTPGLGEPLGLGLATRWQSWAPPKQGPPEPSLCACTVPDTNSRRSSTTAPVQRSHKRGLWSPACPG